MSGNSLSAMCKAVAPALGNHLWQSTLFAIAAGLLTLLLRNNHARTRYLLWLTASLKFLIPFSLLAGVGSHIAWWRGSAANAGVYIAMDQLSQPFSQSRMFLTTEAAPPIHSAGLIDLLPAFLAAVWLCGIAVVVLAWYVRWRRISAVMWDAVPMRDGREAESLRRLELAAGMSQQIEMRVSRTSLEPGIFGIVRPILVWPNGISERLDDKHLEAILAHELCHVRRRDNLSAATHMVVEAIFWFYPVVWWLGAQLLQERERACDEQVLELGSDRQVYAQSILKICEFCVGSPLDFVSGVTGADLKKRIANIMSKKPVRNLNLNKKLLLSAAGIAAIAVPIVLGLIDATRSVAASPAQIASGGATVFQVASIKPSISGVATSRTTVPASEFAPTNVIDHVEKPAEPQTQDTGAIAPAFEVASIKPSKSGSDYRRITFPPDMFNATGVTLRMLVRGTYGVEDDRILGAPNWFNSEEYDIEAKMDKSVVDELAKLSPDQRKVERNRMLQVLFADRFKLSVHRETKELPVYALVIAKHGPKFQESKPGDTYQNGFIGIDGRPAGKGIYVWKSTREVTGQGVPVAYLARVMSKILNQTILDKTGLTGSYDFKLLWIPGDSRFETFMGTERNHQEADNTLPANASEPSIFTAIQGQLGLKLEPQTTSMEILVIDHVEKPSEN